MIRPASYCGVFGYKPTFGSISRRGMSMLARRLDTVGVYARDVEGLALIADALMMYDPQDWDMEKQPQKNLTSALTGSSKAPRFAFVRSPAWKQVEPDMAEAFENFIKNLGDKVSEVELEGLFDDIIPTHRTIMHANVAVTLGEVAANAPDRTRDETKERVAVGNAIAAVDYIRALGRAEAQGQALDRIFDHVDAILTPSATGQAPVGLGKTGKPVFNGMWTMLGVPCVSLPLLTGANGMPMGVQVIGRKGEDAKILHCARWISDQLLGEV